MALQYFQQAYNIDVPEGRRAFSGAATRMNNFSFLFPLICTPLFMSHFGMFRNSLAIRYALLAFISWDRWHHGSVSKVEMYQYLHKYHAAARNAITSSAFLEIAYGCYFLVKYMSASAHSEEMKMTHFLGLGQSIRALKESNTHLPPLEWTLLYKMWMDVVSDATRIMDRPRYDNLGRLLEVETDGGQRQPYIVELPFLTPFTADRTIIVRKSWDQYTHTCLFRMLYP
jgi:hypothetical protein